MIINKKTTSEKVYIIAEIGNNHEGSFEVAKELIFKAAETGVDAVKFQTFNTDFYVSKKYNIDRYNQLKKFEFSQIEFSDLADIAKQKGLDFISTPFDLQSAFFLENIVSAFKISSSDLNFYPLVKFVSQTSKPLILSTGFHSFEEIQLTIDYITQYREISKDNLSIMHCVGNYPTLPQDAQLNTIDFLKNHFPHIEIGYSDHTIGNLASMVAVSKGVRIIEKHFTLDHNFSNFHDHKISADPNELNKLVSNIRELEIYLGSYSKIVNQKEIEIKKQITRRIVANKRINIGHQISWDDFTWIRLENGFKAGDEHLLIGKIAKREIEEGSFFSNDMF
jgi:N,N'-diacetyllegionaminate synthase